jgi:hypothetical protein
MKLHHLFEDDEQDDQQHLTKDLVSTIIEECEPFLDEIRHQPDNYVMYRGIRVKPSFTENPDGSWKTPITGVHRIRVRKDRVPLDISKSATEILNSLFERDFGIKYRTQAAFVKGDKSSTIEYGSPHVILPIGEFKYCWSPNIEDLYVYAAYKFDLEKIGQLQNPEEKIKEVYEKGEYKSNGLLMALTNYKKHEIMVACDEYYAIEASKFFREFMPLYEMIKDKK